LYLTREKAKGTRRRILNRTLFDHIAPGYDRMNTFLSLGRDGAWKRELISRLPNRPVARVLDLATGTGDLAFLLARRFPRARIIGVDLSPQMLALAKKRASVEAPGAPIAWRRGEMAKTGLAPGSVDLVTAGYALRNAPDLGATLAEIARVLKPGGVAAVLEFSRSPHRLVQKLELAFLWLWGGFWGTLIHRNRHIYQYFSHSLALYPEHPVLLERFRDAGLEVTVDRPLYLGMLRILLFRKKAKAKPRA